MNCRQEDFRTGDWEIIGLIWVKDAKGLSRGSDSGNLI